MGKLTWYFTGVYIINISFTKLCRNYVCQLSGAKLSGATDLKLKEKQYEVLKSVVLRNKDVLAILFTAIRHLMQFLNRTCSLGLVQSFLLWLCPQLKQRHRVNFENNVVVACSANIRINVGVPPSLVMLKF